MMQPSTAYRSVPNSIVVALVLAFVALLLGPRPLLAQEKKARDVTQFNLGKDALALQGYDPVAYFKEGGAKPAKGLETISVLQDGVRYRFASEDHKKLFLATPAKYEPAYGGWCAYAMAKKDKVEIDPESFLTTGDRLMVFYKGFFNDTRAKWVKDEAAYTVKADKCWAELIAPPKPK